MKSRGEWSKNNQNWKHELYLPNGTVTLHNII